MKITPMTQSICCLGLLIPLLIIVALTNIRFSIMRTGDIGTAIFNIVLILVVLIVAIVLLWFLLKRNYLQK